MWIFFGVITKLDYISWSFLCILGPFLKVKVQNWGYFGGLPKFTIFFWVLEISDIFGGVNGRCWPPWVWPLKPVLGRENRCTFH